MVLRTFGGHGLINKTTMEDILNRGRVIDDDLACGKRIIADLTKEEKRELEAYRKSTC
jgi:hypothetical protein